MSARVCHQREAPEAPDAQEAMLPDHDEPDDPSEVMELARERAGELKELARERVGELEEDSSVRAEETESSLSETYETASLRLLAACESGGHAWGPVSSATDATRLRLRRRPPLLVRLCKLCWRAPSMVK